MKKVSVITFLTVAVVCLVTANSLFALKTESGSEIEAENKQDYGICRVWGVSLDNEEWNFHKTVALQCFVSVQEKHPHEADFFSVNVFQSTDGEIKVSLKFTIQEMLHKEETINVKYSFDDDEPTKENMEFIGHPYPNSNRYEPNRGAAKKSLDAEELVTFLESLGEADTFSFEFDNEDTSSATFDPKQLDDFEKAVKDFRERIKPFLEES